MVATASLTTVEFIPEGDGTRLILVEFGAYLDGREQPAWREHGTGQWLDALGKDVARQSGVYLRLSTINSRFISRKEAGMAIDHVLAVVPVSDFDAAHQWYERLFGRQADNLPMEGRLVEWRITSNGWVQITTDPVRAGSALLNFAVDDLDKHIAELAQRGLPSGAVEPVNKGVMLSTICDPDGNTITFIDNFRTHY